MGLIHETAEIDAGVHIDDSAFVWALAQVRSGAQIGAECIISRGAYVGSGVVVGARSKIQNYALVYEPAQLAEGVFVGPGAILTNDRLPRAIRPDGALKAASDWQAVGVTVGKGASIGAGAICVAPALIGAWAMVGAGSTVTDDVPSHALVVGTPARQIGWVGRAGHRLAQDVASGHWVCPETDERYLELPSGLELIEELT